MRTWCDIATVVNRKGLDGGLVLEWSAGLSCVLDKGQELFLVPPRLDLPRRIHLSSTVRTDDRSDAIRFDEIEDADVSEAVKGCHVLIDAADLPQDAWSENAADRSFVGWTVEDVDAGCIGKVISAEDRFEQILLEVETFKDAGDGRNSKLIPLVEDIIVDIDEDDELITLECPKGLLDL